MLLPRFCVWRTWYSALYPSCLGGSLRRRVCRHCPCSVCVSVSFSGGWSVQPLPTYASFFLLLVYGVKSSSAGNLILVSILLVDVVPCSKRFSWMLSTGGMRLIESCFVASWNVFPHLLQLYSLGPSFSGCVYRSKQSSNVLPCLPRVASSALNRRPFLSATPLLLFPPSSLLLLLAAADPGACFFFFSTGRRPRLMSSMGSHVVVMFLQRRHVTLDCNSPANVLWMMHSQWDSFCSSHPAWMLFRALIKNSWASCWAYPASSFKLIHMDCRNRHGP